MSSWGPWYEVIKTIKGHRYFYGQRTRREGRRILTQNMYRGRADGSGFIRRRASRGEGSADGGERPAARGNTDRVTTTTATNAQGTASLADALQKVRSYVEADRFTLENLSEIESAVRRGADTAALIDKLDACVAGCSERFVREHLELIRNALARERASGRQRVTGTIAIERWWVIDDDEPAVTTTGTTPPKADKPKARTARIHQARDVAVVDAIAERRLIEQVFDPANKAANWRRPWLDGRTSANPAWMPDRRLYALALKLGVRGKTSAFGGLVDLGWRKKRYVIKAAYSSRNTLEIPDHTRFKGNADATAEQMFAHTILHEIAHATGARDACKRLIWGSTREDYAREEWVADLTARIMAERLGLAPANVANTAWYIDNWGRAITDKAAARQYATREALKAADHLCRLWADINTTAPAGGGATGAKQNQMVE